MDPLEVSQKKARPGDALADAYTRKPRKRAPFHSAKSASNLAKTSLCELVGIFESESNGFLTVDAALRHGFAPKTSRPLTHAGPPVQVPNCRHQAVNAV
jgi:hypothetical protein